MASPCFSLGMFYSFGMENQTIQLIKASEKAKFLIEFKEKANKDVLLYWHWQTVKDDIVSFMFNNLNVED
jgi:hypothetical protein